MPKISAGILVYRWRGGQLQVLLVHPGGPLWRNKDDGVWSIPKGEVDPGEDLLTTARREFAEETGFTAEGPFTPLKSVKLKSGKIVHAWAAEGDLDVSKIKSNMFAMEWPPKSGRQADFPEVDRGDFFPIELAKQKVKPAQRPLIEELAATLSFPLKRDY